MRKRTDSGGMSQRHMVRYGPGGRLGQRRAAQTVQRKTCGTVALVRRSVGGDRKSERMTMSTRSLTMA
jgi:hypothetical protein